jgi:hypothetical protein
MTDIDQIPGAVGHGSGALFENDGRAPEESEGDSDE